MRIGRPAGSVVWAGGLAMCAILGVGCAGAGGPGTLADWVADAGPDAQAETGGTGGGAVTCTPSPRASEDLSPRVDVTRPSASVRVVKTSDLYIRFNSVCGRCHVSATNGGFHVTPETFATVFDASRLARIESEDPNFAMPPEGKAFSSRPPTDPVRVLASYLEPWLAQGRPVDMFIYDGSSAASDPGSASYAYFAMTNLGDCVPSKVAYASSPSSEMEAKDAFFASATALPGDLTETDLTTLDTATLAVNGLIAYRPTYPLWSDGSGKLRFIRVPKGTSIKFDKAKQTFEIPPNTRFYKTFFREVIDKAGRISHKKMETRLILSRPDTVNADGSPQPNALFGTYVWSDDETTATLLDVTYRDGTGFGDRTAEYITNEVAYQDVVDHIGPGAGTLASKLQRELLDPSHAGLVQHYAIPGSLRCVQCHRGSPTQDFVLGFYPLQVAQRAANTGGTYDPVDADELNQLQRFIDYGLITGMTSPSDVVLLEGSQAQDSPPRHPRTPQELKAQAYMIGNCAHCHNPRGYPSLAKPELLTALNFLPGSAARAGIFEFDFEKMSPIRARGANQDVPIPYITPSLRDYPVADVDMKRVDNGAVLSPTSSGNGDSSYAVEVTWSPKYAPDLESPPFPGCSGVSSPGTRAYCGKRTTGRSFVAAPWRSILYRNVDTPFPYFDDYVPFPHMPMNSAGFDCRAPRIMAEWMVGLPAILKPQYRDISEDNLPVTLPDGSHSTYYINAPQPYQEVKPTDDGYADAQAAAIVRLKEYHDGVRYQYCQDILSPDILDPVLADATTARNAYTFYPVPARYFYGGIPPNDPTRPGEYAQPAIGVPYHSEWFDYDPTDPAGAWQPRRGPIWKDILVDGKPDTGVPKGTNIIPDPLAPPTTDEFKVAHSRALLNDALQAAQLTDALRTYATTEIPYALWQPKPECNAKFASGFASGSLKKVSDFSGASVPRPAWMDSVGASLSPDAPVYMASPGEALYRHICFNCHGPRADGKGLQGDALAASSEGQARPANFAAGLFGPPEMPGSNLINVFGLGTGDRKTADTWAPRYMAWMTLGGTLQLIPHDIINQVEATRIFGVGRQHLSKLGLTETVSANMLNLAKGLCALVLPDQEPDTQQLTAIDLVNSPPGSDEYPLFNSTATTPFIRTNGDWEMWMKLCSTFNRQVVRVYQMRNDIGGGIGARLKALYYVDDGSANPPYRFPADGQVWDHNRQQRSGVSADNYYPACVQDPKQILAEDPSTPDLPAPDVLAAFLKNFMPKCPTEFLTRSELVMWSLQKQTPDQIDNVKKWALSGAINAGMSVFSFLEKSLVDQKIASSKNSLLPLYYNECQLLP